ncbi:YbjN domain-containing protein [Micromonospora sp. NPDC049679]|uniref:YbjN domain-containing protein n=1 Tax=Micromonospora sp. NPDC049679 TaxID=3155920 RepID=UPI0033C9A221
MPPSDIGDPSGSGPRGGDLQTLLRLTNELIASVLRRHDYNFSTDHDGDLFGRWQENLIYFFRLGETGQLLQVRTMAATSFDIDDVPRLYAFCNAWNHDRLWPKAFVHVDDDGTARICGEVVADLERGVTTAQLDQLLNCGIATGCQLAEAAAELRS